MENNVEKTVDQIKQEIMEKFRSAAKKSGPMPTVRARKSSLEKFIKTPDQAKRLMILMKAAEDGLI